MGLLNQKGYPGADLGIVRGHSVLGHGSLRNNRLGGGFYSAGFSHPRRGSCGKPWGHAGVGGKDSEKVGPSHAGSSGQFLFGKLGKA